MDAYEFTSKKDIPEVLENLKKYGVTVVPGFLDAETTQQLQDSFFKVLGEEKHECIIKKFGHPTNPEGTQATLDPQKATLSNMREFESVFQGEFIDEIAKAYFEPYGYRLNPHILLTHLKPSDNPILPWHFDRMQTLKFWIYLKDASRNDGALEYCPGTHWEGRYRASYHMAIGTGVEDIPNDVPDHRIQNPVALEAKAGDLIIFDPDGFHRGGVVGPGGERCVLRADTFPTPRRMYYDRPFSSGWWLKTPFNMTRWLTKGHSRTLGRRVADATINRKQH